MITIIGCFTAGYYDQIKDYLPPHLHSFVHYYKQRDVIDLPLCHGCDKKSKNGTRKLINYDQDNKCISPTSNLYWKKTKINTKCKKERVYWTRYMTLTNRRHLFKNKGNFVYNYKLKKFEHMSKTPMCHDYNYLQTIRKDLFKDVFK